LQLFCDLDKRFLGDSLDAENKDGKTPFQVAVDNNKLVCAMGLLVAGVNPDYALRLAIEVETATFLVKCLRTVY
jgi:hypothetical protein